MRVTVAAVIASVLVALPASSLAQSTTIGASLFAEVARSGSFEASGFDSSAQSLNGEALGGGLWIARGLGERWGVQLEVGFPGEVENETTTERFTDTFIPGTGLMPMLVGFGTSSRLSTRRTQTTVSTALWIRQPVGERVTLVYLGGVTFGRLRYESEQESSVTGVPTSFTSLTGFMPIAPTPSTSRLETVSYGVGPVVGLEALVRLTERLAAVPGIKFHSLAGWLIRPGIGVQWTF